jgi:hypothetical protein
MKATEELVEMLRALVQGSRVKVNGSEYLVVDIQTHPEPGFELKHENEAKEEGLEIYLAEAGKEIEDPPIFSADYKLTCVDFDVAYELVDTRDGIEDLSKEYSHDHLIVHDFENGKTMVYGSTYSKKDISEVKISLVDLDDEPVELKTIEF